MLHGYMPRGNVDENLQIPKGQSIQGFAIGMLGIEVWTAHPPGSAMNASSYNFPMLYEMIEEAAKWNVLNSDVKGNQFAPELKEALILGARKLQKQGVRAITGSCGFFANFQKDVAAAVNIPVFLSSLCQIPMIRLGLKPGQKIGILTAASDLLGTETFHQINVDDMSDLIIVGAQDYGEFYWVRATHANGHLNPFKVEQDLTNLAKELIKDNPDVGVILLECAAMAPYSWGIQNGTNLPVFDLQTLIKWIYTGVLQQPFAGFY